MSPLWTRAETPVMPKARYRIMTDYMPKVGSLGLDMMYRTSTVQVNMDYASEADMVKKLRVSLALQPIATAIFANSPFTDGKPNGYLSMRSKIWRDTDRRPHGHDGLRLRGGLRLRALCGLGARRADVLRQARLDLSRRGRRLLPRSASPASSRSCRASAPRTPTGRTTSRPCFRKCASSAISRCAARMWARPSTSWRSPPSGPDFSTTRRRSTAPGNW